MPSSARLMPAALVVLLAGCTTASRPATRVSTPASTATGCDARIETGPLPDWADAGFSGDARVPHVFGVRGEIVAVLFGHPLTYGRADEPSNKILWVARPATASSGPEAPATLLITATLDGAGTRATREVAGGPGPSIIDLPGPGCWHLELRWSGRTDRMDLVYAGS
ncbi:hypothetical protein ACL02O_05155 [Micromonospora sp. MS34]|uniref:hypothetical protein n=1 Tax=Micromonospora sp. MS34 TaxID=3385971 RepID=UPI00399F23C8